MCQHFGRALMTKQKSQRARWCTLLYYACLQFQPRDWLSFFPRPGGSGTHTVRVRVRVRRDATKAARVSCRVVSCDDSRLTSAPRRRPVTPLFLSLSVCTCTAAGCCTGQEGRQAYYNAHSSWRRTVQHRTTPHKTPVAVALQRQHADGAGVRLQTHVCV